MHQLILRDAINSRPQVWLVRATRSHGYLFTSGYPVGFCVSVFVVEQAVYRRGWIQVDIDAPIKFRDGNLSRYPAWVSKAAVVFKSKSVLVGSGDLASSRYVGSGGGHGRPRGLAARHLRVRARESA